MITYFTGKIYVILVFQFVLAFHGGDVLKQDFDII